MRDLGKLTRSAAVKNVFARWTSPVRHLLLGLGMSQHQGEARHVASASNHIGFDNLAKTAARPLEQSEEDANNAD